MVKLQPGQVVEVHSLQSEAGQKLNGKRALVIRSVEEGYRYEVRIEHGTASTNAIKPTNLKLLSRLALPAAAGRPRGMVHDVDSEMPRVLCELLVMPRGGYEPPEITNLSGFAGLALSQFDRFSLNFFTKMEMEWFSGLFGLVNFIKQGPKTACEDIVFALLEADPMILDVLILSLTFTPYIGDEKQKAEQFRAEFNNPRMQLTPDQFENGKYLAALTTGPLMILHSILCSPQKKGSSLKFTAQAFKAGLQTSEVYMLLIQRLVRLTAKEYDMTNSKAGLMSRQLLLTLCGEYMSDEVRALFEQGPLFPENADIRQGLMTRSNYFDCTPEYMKAMFMRTFSEISMGQII